ncbi:MAG TPA: hypothetical protein VLV49_00640 [Terriglobales bacterium]|nr:hypothetical protein [Terriglobales bacterium]
MKKTLRLLAVLVFLTAIGAPTMMVADGMPSPACGAGMCVPRPTLK